MKIANSSNTNKHKGKAALANQFSHKHAAVSKEDAAKMHLAMKACHMHFTQALNLLNENDPMKRASYGSMQGVIDFLAKNGHPGVQPHQIVYHQDKKWANQLHSS